jgi:hypothetical protein
MKKEPRRALEARPGSFWVDRRGTIERTAVWVCIRDRGGQRIKKEPRRALEARPGSFWVDRRGTVERTAV